MLLRTPLAAPHTNGADTNFRAVKKQTQQALKEQGYIPRGIKQSEDERSKV